MNVLITGSNGFVGSELMYLLEEHGYRVLGIDRAKDTGNRNHPKTLIGDLNDTSTYDLIDLPIDVIIHCAAAKSDFGISTEEYFADNVTATENVVKFAESLGIHKIIYYSTVSVYGHQNHAMHESADLLSNTVYGDTKLQGERVIERWLTSNEANKAIMLRPSVIYGENNFANMYNLLDMLYRRPLVMIGKGDYIKSMIARKNLIDLNLFLLKRGVDIKLEAFNCIDKPYISLNQLMTLVAEEDGFSIPKISIPLWLAYLMATPFEILSKLSGKDLKVNWNRLKKFSTSTDYRAEKIRSIGYIQKFSTEDEIKAMCKWYKSTKG